MDWLYLVLNIIAAVLAIIVAALPLIEKYQGRRKRTKTKQVISNGLVVNDESPLDVGPGKIE